MAKSFKDNPALQFISDPTPDAGAARPAQTEPAIADPADARAMLALRQAIQLSAPTESKSRRIQLLIRPSTFDKLKALSGETGQSMNEIINVALEMLLRAR